MAGADRQRPLFSEPSDTSGPVVVNDRCLLRTAHGFRVVVVSGVVSAQYAVEDRMAEAYAMVNLVEQGWATQQEGARAFAGSARKRPASPRRERAAARRAASCDPLKR